MRQANYIRSTFLLSLLFICYTSSSQNIEAHYKVVFPLNISQQETKANIVHLRYEGYLYRSGGKHIYFQKPLYLSEYPTGEILVTGRAGYSVFPLWTDTLQRIAYNNIDSLIFRTRDDITGSSSANEYYLRYFEPGISDWQLLSETKNINGLECQHAKQYNGADSSLLWDVWFYPDISINFGPSDIRDIPGLVVDARNVQSGEVFTLETYMLNTKIPDNIFWPAEFSHAVFTKLKPLQKYQNKGKNAAQKRLDIINQ
jgi:GLPGLI family protein